MSKSIDQQRSGRGALGAAVAFMCVTAGLTSAASAAQFIYTPGSPDSTSWDPAASGHFDSTPVSASDTRVTFGSAGTTPTYPEGTYTSTNNIAAGLSANGNFLLNVLDLGGTRAPVTVAANTSTSVGIAGTGLEFVSNGATTPVVNLVATQTTATISSTAYTNALGYNISSGVRLANDTTFTGNGTASFTFGGAITGPGKLTKTGTSTLTLSGNNSSYSNGITVTGGRVAISAANNLGSGPLTLNGGAILTNSTTVSTSIDVAVTANSTVFTGSNTVLTFDELNLDAGRTLTFSPAVTSQSNIGQTAFTGTTTLNGNATLLVDTGGISGNSTAITLAGVTVGNSVAANTISRLTFNNRAGVTRTRTINVNGVVQDNASDATKKVALALTSVSGSQTGTVLNINGANTYTGGTTLNIATLNVGTNGTLGGGSTTVDGGTLTATGNGKLGTGALAVNGGSVTVNSAQNVGSFSGTGTTQTLTLTGATSILNVTQSADGTYNGILAGTGGLALTATSSAALTLTNANTYGGGTTVNAGTLYVNNGSGSATGAAGVTVGVNGTLAGTGSISGTITVNGTISPGSVASPIESLAVGGLTLGGNAVFAANFDTDLNDSIAVTNADSFTYGGTLTVNFAGDGSAGGVFDLFAFTGNAGGSFSSYVFTGLGAGEVASFDEATGVVTVTVPEPAMLAVIGLMGFGLAGRRQRCA